MNKIKNFLNNLVFELGSMLVLFACTVEFLALVVSVIFKVIADGIGEALNKIYK